MPPATCFDVCSIDRWHGKPGVTMPLSINKVAA
jgi:hypothetical protein